MQTGIRELKDNLSRYIRRVEAGERVVATNHGRVVADLVRPAAGRESEPSQFSRMLASGVITPPVEDGDPLEDCPEIRLAPGTAAALTEGDRDDPSALVTVVTRDGRVRDNADALGYPVE